MVSTRLAERALNKPAARDAWPQLSVEVLTDDTAFDRIEGDWDELVESSRLRVYFLRWDWNRTWWRTYQPACSQLFLVTGREENGRLYINLKP